MDEHKRTMAGETILHLPAPLSVNMTRRINYAASPLIREWHARADALFLTQKPLASIVGQFEALVTINPKSRLDLDNGLKQLIDAARNYELVEDDSPKFLRRIVAEFGEAPHGAVVRLRGIQ